MSSAENKEVVILQIIEKDKTHEITDSYPTFKFWHPDGNYRTYTGDILFLYECVEYYAIHNDKPLTAKVPS